MSYSLLSIWVIKDFAVFILGQDLRFQQDVSLTSLRALVGHSRWHQFLRKQRIRESLVHLGLCFICKGKWWLANLLRRGLLWPLAVNVRGRRFPLVRLNICASMGLVRWCLLLSLWRGRRVLLRAFRGWFNQRLRLYLIHNLVGIVYLSSCRYISTSLYEMISQLLRETSLLPSQLVLHELLEADHAFLWRLWQTEQMKVPVDRSHSLIEVVDELLHLEEAPIKVLREHFEDCAHLVYYLMLIPTKLFVSRILRSPQLFHIAI